MVQVRVTCAKLIFFTMVTRWECISSAQRSERQVQRILDWDFFDAFETIRRGTLFPVLADFLPDKSYFGAFGF